MPKLKPNVKLIFEMFKDDANIVVDFKKGCEDDLVVLLLALITGKIYDKVLSSLDEFVQQDKISKEKLNELLQTLTASISILEKNTNVPLAIKPSQVFR